MALTLTPLADAPPASAWSGIPSPIGHRARIPAHDLTGTVTTYRLMGGMRLLKIETPDGAQIDVMETECEPWTGQAAPRPAPAHRSAPPEGSIKVQVMTMAAFCERIAADPKFAATVSPESVQMLARDWLAYQADRRARSAA